MYRFPVIGGYHFDRIPGTAVKECSIRSLTDALLATNAKIWVYFDAPEWRMIFIRNPEHAGFDRTVFDASRRSRATGTTVGRDREYSWPLLAGCLAIAF
jgi:hypothetical protein